MQGLPDIYKEIHIVNRGFAERVRTAVDSDAGPNAIIRLDTFASMILMSLDTDKLESLDSLFSSYYADDASENE